MNGKEYVKLNTSIQTGSNSQNLIRDDEGNIEASIELRLPDNLFDANSHTRHVEKVEMQTSKMRLSMEETPIAYIPVDLEQSSPDNLVSTCKVDIYPYSYTSNGTWQPDNTPDNTALPYYNSHTADIELDIIWKYGTEDQFTVNFGHYKMVADSTQQWWMAPYVKLVQELIVNNKNMYIPSNHETLKPEGGKVAIKSVSTLSQMWEDVLETNFVSSYIPSYLPLHIVIAQTDTKPPNAVSDIMGYYSGFGNFYLLELSIDKTRNVAYTTSSGLAAAIKPQVRFSEQSFSISYDTSPFTGIAVPVIWNPAFVNTYETPKQLTPAPASNYYTEPPRRRLRYNASNGSSGSSYSFYVSGNESPSVVNIVGNKATVDTFSFLPWVKVPRPTVEHPVTQTVPRTDIYFRERLAGTYTSVRITGTKKSASVDIPVKSYTTTGVDYNGFKYVELTFTKSSEGVVSNAVFHLGTYGDPVVESTVTSVDWGTLSGPFLPNTPPNVLPKVFNTQQYPYPNTTVRMLTLANQTITLPTATMKTVSSITAFYNDSQNYSDSPLMIYLIATSGVQIAYCLPMPKDDVVWTSDNPYERLLPQREPEYQIVDADGTTNHWYWLIRQPADSTTSGNIVIVDSSKTLWYFKYMSPTPTIDVNIYGNYTASSTSVTKANGLCTIADEDDIYLLDGSGAIPSIEGPYYVNVNGGPKGDTTITFRWDNLPIVILSPIASIVLTLQGVQVSQEYQPVNITQGQGSSLTSTIPVIENFYTLAQTLRDLHDELVVVKDTFDDVATYDLSAASGKERTLRLSAHYIAKDGSLHQIYIPPNGVFSVQLTFGISYYIS